MFLLLVILLKITQIDGLECYHCFDVRNVSDCHTLVTCPADNMCFTGATGTGDQIRFNLTCKPKQECHTLSTTTTSPSSMTGFHNTDCTQCCAKPACNTYLCSMGTQSITSTGQCHDDPKFDCPQLSSLLNICSDVPHAKAVCRDFCGLCDLVDGGWANWNSWATCSVTCGNGTISRQRTCTNPSPAHGGVDCSGISKQDSTCHNKDCPIAGGWSAWLPWGSCSVSCGVGLQRRDRSCSNPYPGIYGDHCFGDSKVYKSCFDRSCADGAWSSWSPWGTCSATCDFGLQSRTRRCTNPAPTQFGLPCLGTDVDKQICNQHKCPAISGTAISSIIGAWSGWSSWGICSATCNGGLQSRTRTCNNHICQGSEIDKQLCNTHNCPAISGTVISSIIGAWSNWSSWGICSATCNSGLQSRTRTCNNHICQGSEIDKQPCNTHNCPAMSGAPLSAIIGAWSGWSSWGICSATCNGGLQSRTRTCNNHICQGSEIDKQLCNTHNCPAISGTVISSIIGAWSNWSSWGICSATCNSGLQSRTRTCNNHICQGSEIDKQLCNTHNCPAMSGAWSNWSYWGICSNTCNSGLQSRTRTCNNHICQGSEIDKQLCNTHNCPEKKVAFSVYDSSSTLTSDSTETFTTTIMNTGSYDMATGKFTCPVAGIYIFSLTIRHDHTNTGSPTCHYRVNGVNKSYVQAPDALVQSSGTIIVTLAVDDVVDLACYDWEHDDPYDGAMFSGALITPT